MMKTHTRIGLAAAAALAWAGTAAQAQTITLRVADALPNGHIAHQFILRPFMEAVTKATSGQVVFQHFPAEQLGKAKDMLALTQTGVADMALTSACVLIALQSYRGIGVDGAASRRSTR